jgi:hypothetical protein
MQAAAFLRRQLRQQQRIGRQRFKQCRRFVQPLQQGRVCVVRYGRGRCGVGQGVVRIGKAKMEGGGRRFGRASRVFCLY